jgi:hypothetical protein
MEDQNENVQENVQETVVASAVTEPVQEQVVVEVPMQDNIEQVQETEVPAAVVADPQVQEAPVVTDSDEMAALKAKLAALTAEVEARKAEGPSDADVFNTGVSNGAVAPSTETGPDIFAGSTPKPPKNHVMGKAKGGSYIRLTNGLLGGGKIPQQQADLAAILVANMPLGEPVSEERVFGILVENKDKYLSLRQSKQHVTYLFRYYRGLKAQAPHAGFVARGFLRAA